ncbi:hypothetical protein D9758_000389 [Tetrapyrgos nigripes]|uniref:Pentatricopeptide repeat-containing protein-mitochondrial domain-containing protein n=1 Tax=Tetrapyrgos nigripes TaxID=182062 RepID=A0A8H5H1I8_9AGAR|nr:hypothetical protein D9758_000389 [Tetrapyrgos nigripes]
MSSRENRSHGHMRRLTFFLDLPLVRRASTCRPILVSIPVSHRRRARDDIPNQLFDRIKDVIIRKHTSHGVDVFGEQADVFNRLLAKINMALKKQDIDGLHRCWHDLEQKGLTRFLANWDLGRISDFAVSYLSSPDVSVSFDSPREWMEDISVMAANAHQTEALKSCMVYHIRHNNPQAVLDLYDRCKSVMSEGEPLGDNSQESHERHDSLALTPESLNTGVYIPGRVNLLLAATTAHAMRDSFQDALRTYSETSVRFHHFSTRSFCALLDHDPLLQRKVELYTRRLSVARLLARPPSLSKQITNFAKSGATHLLQKLYESVIQGMTDPHPYLAADPTLITPNKSVAMTEVGWTSFLSAFLECRRKDLAGKVWQDVLRLGLSHNVSMWTALIDGYAKTASFSDAVATWDSMISAGVEPNVLTYRALISALFNGKRPQMAMERYHQFRMQLMNQLTGEQNLLVMNTVLHGLLATNRIDHALAFLNSMETGPYKPDVVSYNTFIGHYGRAQNLKSVGAMINRMAAAKIPGDAVTFTSILSVLLRMGRKDRVDMVFRMMEKQGTEANVTTYNSIIDRLLREQDETSLQGAVALLHRMETNSNSQPDAITYSILITGIHRGQWLPRDKAEDWTRQILTRMRSRNIKLPTQGYNVLIDASIKNGQIQTALSYYREMLRQKVPIIFNTWCLILSALVEREEWKTASEVVNEMNKSGFRPTGILSELIGKVYRRISTGTRRPGAVGNGYNSNLQ